MGWEDDTALWARLGGFVAGIVAALLLLFTRQVYARGDILSAALFDRVVCPGAVARLIMRRVNHRDDQAVVPSPA